MGYRIFFSCCLLLIALVGRANEIAHLGETEISHIGEIAPARDIDRINEIESPNELRMQVDAFLQEALRGEYVGIEPGNLEVAVSNLDARLRLNKCSAPLRQEITSPRPFGSNLSVKVNCDGAKPWTIYVPARVDVYAEVVVLARSLNRGTVITEDDVVLKRMNIAQAGFGNIRDLSQVVGMELKRRLQAGEPVRLSHVKLPQVVRRGDKVTLEAATGSILVITNGTALANGQVGDQIQVRNEKSKRVVDAEVIAPGKVRVTL